MASPERVGGWINTIVPVLEKGGPITTLILGLCAMAMIYGLYKELSRTHEVAREFFNKLEACYQAQFQMARECPPWEKR